MMESRGRPIAAALVPVLSLVLFATFAGAQSFLTDMSFLDNPAVYSVGDIVANTLSFTNPDLIVVQDWAITPSLPVDLTFDAQTLVLGGTLTNSSVASERVHTFCPVCATDCFGCAQLHLTVTDEPPTIQYLDGTDLVSVVEVRNDVGVQLLRSVVPTASGGSITSYSISPPLPPGLSFDDQTGTISGTPTAARSNVPYTITASNSGGSSQLTVFIEVLDPTQPVLNTRLIIESADNAELSLLISYITIGFAFLFAIVSFLIFLAWRARQKNVPPPLLISDQAVEKLGRSLAIASGSKNTAQSNFFRHMRRSASKAALLEKGFVDVSDFHKGGEAKNEALRKRPKPGRGNSSSRAADLEMADMRAGLQNKLPSSANGTTAPPRAKTLRELCQQLDIPVEDVAGLQQEEVTVAALYETITPKELEALVPAADSRIKLLGAIQRERQAGI